MWFSSVQYPIFSLTKWPKYNDFIFDNNSQELPPSVVLYNSPLSAKTKPVCSEINCNALTSGKVLFLECQGSGLIYVQLFPPSVVLIIKPNSEPSNVAPPHEYPILLDGKERWDKGAGKVSFIKVWVQFLPPSIVCVIKPQSASSHFNESFK